MALGLTSSGSPTGLPAADAFWRILLATVVVGLAPVAGPVAWLVAGVIGFVAGDGPTSLLGLAVAVIALVQLARRLPRTPWPVGAVVGGVLAGVALHLPTSVGSNAGALPAGLLVLTIGVVGGFRLSGRSGRAVRIGAGVVALAVVVATGLGVRQILAARRAFSAGIAASQNGVDLVRANKGDDAVRAFERSGAQFLHARELLQAPLGVPAHWVPGLGIQFRALTDAGQTGNELARSGARIVAANNLEGLRLVDGELPMAAIEGLAPSLQEATRALDAGLARMSAIRSPWLLGAIDRRLDDAVEKVTTARAESEQALVAARVLPPLLGADGTRRYFLGLVTPAEARGTGGLIGNYAEITADGRTLDMPVQGRDSDLQTATPEGARHLSGPADFLAHYGRFQPAQTWANITMSPDFPTTAGLVAQLYPQSGGRPIDGVIILDPIGLSALLKVIGPVTVAEWPEPITSENVAQILFIDQYVRFPDIDERRELLDEVTKAAFDQFSNAAFSSPKALIDVMAPAVAGRHLMVGSIHPAEMADLERLGLAAKMPAVRGDALTVVTQNGTGNKIDSFLHRDIRYDAKVDPASGAITATATVSLRNDAPAEGLPRYIIGNSYDPPLPNGTSMLYVSVYTPWNLTDARVEGVKQVFDVNQELGRNVYSRFIQVPPGATVTFQVDLAGTGSFASGYHLDVFHTTQVNPDRVTANVVFPPGWVATPRTGGGHLMPGVPVETDTDAVLDLTLVGPRTKPNGSGE